MERTKIDKSIFGKIYFPKNPEGGANLIGCFRESMNSDGLKFMTQFISDLLGCAALDKSQNG